MGRRNHGSAAPVVGKKLEDLFFRKCGEGLGHCPVGGHWPSDAVRGSLPCLGTSALAPNEAISPRIQLMTASSVHPEGSLAWGIRGFYSKRFAQSSKICSRSWPVSGAASGAETTSSR